MNLGRPPQLPSSMLVQEIPKTTAGQPKKPARGSVYYGRAALDSTAQQTRIARHLLELEQDNYHPVQIDVPKPESIPPARERRGRGCATNIFGIDPRQRHKTTPNVRKLLTTRKTLTNLLDEAGLAPEVYRNANVKAGPYPSRTFCSVCGYWGRYGCMKCGDRYCGEACGETHRGLSP